MLRLDLRNCSEQLIQVVVGHREDEVGLAAEAGAKPAAAMVFERTSELAYDVDGKGGGRETIGCRNARRTHHESLASTWSSGQSSRRARSILHMLRPSGCGTCSPCTQTR